VLVLHPRAVGGDLVGGALAPDRSTLLPEGKVFGERDELSKRPPEQHVERQVERLAADIPQRKLDASERLEDGAVAGIRHHLDVGDAGAFARLDVERVQADEGGLQVLVDDRCTFRGGGLAEADEPRVGEELDDHLRVARVGTDREEEGHLEGDVDGRGPHTGDLHGAHSPQPLRGLRFRRQTKHLPACRKLVSGPSQLQTSIYQAV
jgi:hypothetical protein